MNHRFPLRPAALALVAVMLVSLLSVPAMASTSDRYGNEIIVITLDPGHGGDHQETAEGAEVKYNGVTYKERDLDLKIAQYCKAYLEENYWNVKVLMTRGEGQDPSYEDRVGIAAKNDSDFLLSVHLNALYGYMRGALAFVPQGVYKPEQGKISKDVAALVLEELESLGINNRGMEETLKNERYPDGTKMDAYFVVRLGVEMDVPTIIVEHCFIDNYSDFHDFLSSEAKLQALGAADAKALAEYFDLKPMSAKPPEYTSSAENGDTPFEDIFENAWYYDDVTYTYQNGLIRGMTETTFEPKGSATRAMVVALLYRLEGTEEKATQVTFRDVSPEDWYYNEVEWAYANGVTTGMDVGIFDPNLKVTREQFVTFLYRYAVDKGYKVESQQDLTGFTDVQTISDYAVDAMRWAVEKGLIKGYDDGTLLPGNGLIRAELAALMHRFDEYLVNEVPGETEPTVPEETEPTIPEETEPTIPKETEPTIPEETEPTIPEETEPTIPEETEPTIPEETEPTIPEETEPTIPDEIGVIVPADTETETKTE